MTRYLQRTKNEHSVRAPRELAVSAVLQEGDIVETHLQFIWRGDVPCPPLSDSGHQSPAEHTLGNMRLGNVPTIFFCCCDYSSRRLNRHGVSNIVDNNEGSWMRTCGLGGQEA